MQPFITSAGELARLFMAIMAMGGTAGDIRRNVSIEGFEGLLEGFEEDWNLAMYISEMCPDMYMAKADRILDGLVSIEVGMEDRDMKLAVELSPIERDTFATARRAEEAYLSHVA